ncbi:MAG: alpha/beta hydrolase [Chloroflexi bacterium]|nr:alpha/beta hydrolase [Chloroflexota bacterium]
MIPFIDFGGQGPELHFAHANAYPPRAYTPLIETLTPRYHVTAMLARPLWPEARPEELPDWWALVDDEIRFFEERGQTGIIGVGHSLGSMTTLAAALRRPELFRAVVLIDPVLFNRRLLSVYLQAQKWGLARRVHPLVPAALRRRVVFASAEAMFANYRHKAVFRRMDDRALRAYVDSVARLRPDGQVELLYSPEWEVKVYETGPFSLWDQLSALRPPLLIVRGARTDTLWLGTARRVLRYLPQAAIYTVDDATHLVPLEKPVEVGEVIKSFLEKVAASETEN